MMTGRKLQVPRISSKPPGPSNQPLISQFVRQTHLAQDSTKLTTVSI